MSVSRVFVHRLALVLQHTLLVTEVAHVVDGLELDRRDVALLCTTEELLRQKVPPLLLAVDRQRKRGSLLKLCKSTERELRKF